MNFSPRRAAIRRSRRSKAVARLVEGQRTLDKDLRRRRFGGDAVQQTFILPEQRLGRDGREYQVVDARHEEYRPRPSRHDAVQPRGHAGNAVPAYAAVNHVRFGEVFGPGAPLGEAVAEHHRVVRPHGERLLLTAFREVVVAAVVERVGLSSERDRRGGRQKGQNQSFHKQLAVFSVKIDRAG